MIKWQIIFIVINVVMAAYHAYLIGHNAKIYHGWWALGYLVAALFATYLQGEWFLLPILLVLRKSVFDLSLNTFRSLPLWYVSATSGSVLDSFNNKVFKSAKVMYGAYISVWAILNLIYFLWKR